ncbi:MAG: NADH-quinone oxidoreductase subunit J [Chloroflexota bacterium]
MILQIVFLAVLFISLLAALEVVSSNNLVHSALWLIVTLAGVAVLYAMLNATFLAVVQVVVYIGAIAILFVLMVMVSPVAPKSDRLQTNRGWWLPALASAGFFFALVWLMRLWPGFVEPPPPLTVGSNDLLKQLGAQLVSPDGYVLPFELASILLVAAMIGAIWVARERKHDA